VPPWLRALVSLVIIAFLVLGVLAHRDAVRTRQLEGKLAEAQEQLSGAEGAYKRTLDDAEIERAGAAEAKARLEAAQAELERLGAEAAEAVELRRRVEHLLGEIARQDQDLVELKAEKALLEQAGKQAEEQAVEQGGSGESGGSSELSE